VIASAPPTLAAQRQHAVTSAVMMTARDPWVNMLPTTEACLAASVGGAGAFTALPLATPPGVPDNSARRIAQNTPAILHDEAPWIVLFQYEDVYATSKRLRFQPRGDELIRAYEMSLT